MAFAPDEKSDMPKLVVNFTGTTISAPGETRELGADDVTTYVYDASKRLTKASNTKAAQDTNASRLEKFNRHSA